MCGVTNCAHRWREVLNLRALANDLTEGGQNDPLTMQVPVALLLHDVCIVLGLEAQSVLGEETLARIHMQLWLRLWPTIAEDEADELAETDAIREGVSVRDTSSEEEERRINEYEMWRGPRPF